MASSLETRGVSTMRYGESDYPSLACFYDRSLFALLPPRVSHRISLSAQPTLGGLCLRRAPTTVSEGDRDGGGSDGMDIGNN